MRQPLIPMFVALALTALPAAFVQGVRSGAEPNASAATAARAELPAGSARG